MKVHQKYDYVNLEWLLYGKGEMMVSEEGTSFSSSNHDYLPSLFDENQMCIRDRYGRVVVLSSKAFAFHHFSDMP